MKPFDWWCWFLRLVGAPLLVCHCLLIDLLAKAGEYRIVFVIIFNVFGLFWICQSKSIRKEFFE